MGAFDSPLLKAFNREPEVFMWGAGVFAAFILIFFGRYVLRAIITKRTRSIHSATAMTFGDIASMKDRGVLSEEEYKRVRSRLAHRELEATREEKASLKAKDILLAIDQDPEAARKLIPPSGERAKRAMAGLAPDLAKPAEGGGAPAGPDQRPKTAPAPRRAAPKMVLEEGFGGMPIPPEAGEADAAGDEEDFGGMPIPADAGSRPEPGAPEPTPSPAAVPARPEPAPEAVHQPALARTEEAAPEPKPNTPSRPAKPSPATPAASAPEPTPPPRDRGQDIDVMLAKGLISKDEYERLAAFFKPGGDDPSG